MIKPENVERALQEIRKGFAQYEYFFDQLNSPAWLEPLAEHGFFQSPPRPIEDGDTISLPLWPESRYLVRMSRRPEAQETVLKIVLRIPKTDNSRVHDDLANIVLSLPAAYAAKLVPQACQWVQSPFKLLLPEKIGDLIAHLAKGKEGKAALVLARAALALGPDPTFKKGEKLSLIGPEPRANFSRFYYDRILQKGMPELVRTVGIEAIRLCFDLLDDAIKYSIAPTDPDDSEDYIYIRHPAIEQGKARDDIPDTLLCFARDSAEQLISADRSQFGAVFELLKAKRWTSFRRLELHLCRVFGEEGTAKTEEFFQKPELLDQPSLQHEATLLLKSRFGTLTDPTRQRILEWMDTEPSRELIQRWLEFVGQPVSEEKIKAISDQRRRDRFAILQGQLPEPYRDKFDALEAATGPARKLEEVRTIQGGAFSPTAPKSEKELGEMSTPEVLGFLETWSPQDSAFEANAEGLGRELAAVVERKATDFADTADAFKALDPTYVRSFFSGLTTALKKGESFPWPSVLDLAAWVTSQPREIPGRKGELFVRDPDWGWTRDSIIELLLAGFEEHPGKLSLDARQRVWRTLEPLAEDPFPTKENEKEGEADPAFLAINSTRGRALVAVVQYALWVQQNTSPKIADWQQNTLNEMPEVLKVLNRHLDENLEPTLAIRTVYGRCLLLLARLDWQWLQDHLGAIFPLADEDTPQFRAAWDSFLAASQPNTSLLPFLRPYYRHAIEQIEKPIAKMQRPADPDDRLSEHLMNYYWWGSLESESDRVLLTDFYKVAPDQLRAHAMWFIGRTITDSSDEIPDAVVARLQALFELRLRAAREAVAPTDFLSELMAFGWWFTSGKFDEKWSLAILFSVLQLATKVADDMDVVKKLAELAGKYPDECVSCLSIMVKGDRDRWLLVGVEKEVEDLLTLALNSGTAREPARHLIEDLMARGHFRFRTLLKTAIK